MRRNFASLMIAVVGASAPLLAAPRVAAAAITAPDETPEALYEEGRKAYRLGDYKAAVTKWERAYALSDNALLLYNISLAYKGLFTITNDLADLRRARAVIDNFITIAQANPDVDIDDAEVKRDEYDTLIAEVEQARADDKPPPPIPPIEDSGNEPKPLDLGEDPGRKLRIGGIATMAAGGAIALAGGAVALSLAVKSQEFGDNLARDNDTYTNVCPVSEQDTMSCLQLESDINHWRKQGRQANTLAVALGASLGGLGVVALIAGGLVFNEGNKRTKLWEKGARAGSLRLIPAPRGFVLTGRF